MHRRLALAPTAVRVVGAIRPHPAARCVAEGRGEPPRHWIGCAGDPGPPRALSGLERMAVGMPIDVNGATADDLAPVPGLSARLAAEVVAERARRGPFTTVDELIRVRGIGPGRLARARSFLTTQR